MRGKEDPIALAKERIAIDSVLYDLFEIEVPVGGESWKAHCPLEMEHSDEGRTKAMRVYADSNSAWCFSHRMRFDPVSLWMLKFDTSAMDAANSLLDQYGIDHGPRTQADRWNSLNVIEPPKVDRYALRGLLMFYLQSLDGYQEHQYDSRLLALINKILATVNNLDEYDTLETQETWLRLSKEALNRFWRDNGWD